MIYGTTAVAPYIASLVGSTDGEETETARLKRSFDAIKDHEQTLLEPLIEFLKSKYHVGVRIVGLATADASIRAPTISFVVVEQDGQTIKLKSKDIVSRMDLLRTVRKASWKMVPLAEAAFRLVFAMATSMHIDYLRCWALTLTMGW